MFVEGCCILHSRKMKKKTLVSTVINLVPARDLKNIPSHAKKVKVARYSTLQNSLLLPPLPEQPNANRGVWVSLDIAHLEELVLAAEREEMRKEGVKVRLGAKVEDLWIVRMVDVCEYAKELAVDRPDGRREGRVEGLVCVG